MNKKIIPLVFALIFSLNFASAIIVSGVSQGDLFSGGQTNLNIELKNDLNEDVEDVSFNLVLANMPFISIGSSEKSFDEFKEDKTKSFTINIKSSQNIQPGDYNIPYSLSYADKDGKLFQKTGSIGIIVKAKTELDFAVETENSVIGEKGKISLKIINDGFGDIKFVNVKITPKGFSIIGSNSDYIGTVSSDDFEIASFDIVFNDKNSVLDAIVEYKDFDNKDQIQNIQIPIKVYTKKEAIDLGIIEKNNTFFYAIGIILVIILFIFYRVLRKRSRKNKS